MIDLEARLLEFYTPAEAFEWLFAEHPLLKGRRAIDLIAEGRSGEVLAVLQQLDDGVYI